jgi:NurA domain-containing protein
VLDLEALIGGMHDLAQEVVRSARETVRQREAGVAQLQIARNLEGLRDAVLRFNEDMALPAPGLDMGRTHPAPSIDDYTVLATDGSQVAPDYHHIAPWYIVNPGCAVFRYGAPEGRQRCRLSSHPRLLPPARAGLEQDSNHGEEALEDAQAAAVGVRGPLEVERLEAELELAVQLLHEEGDAGRTVLLLDGPLVQWRMIHAVPSRTDRERLIRVFRALVANSQETGTPVAGFISRSRAVSWVTLLRFTLCPQVAEGGSLCPACQASLLKNYMEPPPEAHHARLAGLRDVELARMLLPEPGMRTEVVELRSTVWTDITGGAGAAGFFYLNTGTEIARVELPRWVWNSPELIQRLHAVLWDQCETGHGYPMVLAEAHEASVVRAADRQAFYSLIERILEAHDLHTMTTSAKALSKSRPFA